MGVCVWVGIEYTYTPICCIVHGGSLAGRICFVIELYFFLGFRFFSFLRCERRHHIPIPTAPQPLIRFA